MGAIGSSACSLTTKSRTNLVLSVRSACFATQEQHAPCSRLLLRSCPGRHAEHRADNANVLAGRSLAAIFRCLADMRSIAALGVFESSQRPSAISENREHSDGSSRARSASDEGGIATCQLGHHFS